MVVVFVKKHSITLLLYSITYSLFFLVQMTSHTLFSLLLYDFFLLFNTISQSPYPKVLAQLSWNGGSIILYNLCKLRSIFLQLLNDGWCCICICIISQMKCTLFVRHQDLGARLSLIEVLRISIKESGWKWIEECVIYFYIFLPSHKRCHIFSFEKSSFSHQL